MINYLMRLITCFLLILLHTVNKIAMYSLPSILNINIVVSKKKIFPDFDLQIKQESLNERFKSYADFSWIN